MKDQIDRDQILRDHPLIEYCQSRDMEFRRMGGELYARCPFHDDGKRPNFRVNEDKELWHCDVCGVGGSVIDLVSRLENISIGEAMAKLSGREMSRPAPRSTQKPTSKKDIEEQPDLKLVATYDYTDENGKLIFQALRYDPKTFRQRRPDGKGGWVWNLDGVTRVLFNLPQILKNDNIFIVEGEKDACQLRDVGFCATTNVGGAGRWLESYCAALKGKSVVLCGDNDPKGEEHMEKVLGMLGDKPKSVRQIRMPAGVKDVSDFIALFSDKKEAVSTLLEMVDKSDVIRGYEKMPIFSISELEEQYVNFCHQSAVKCFNFGTWIPSMMKDVRPIVPGELVVVAADTGAGKSIICENIAVAARPLFVLMFQLEIPGTLQFERMVSAATQTTSKEVHSAYMAKQVVPWKTDGLLSHVAICPVAGLTVEKMKKYAMASELKFGKRPDMVIIDYLQIIKAEGKVTRYERFSNIAEDLKVMAKELNIIVLVASQVTRDKDRKTNEVFLHDCKESGSIENSCGLLLGAWRDRSDTSLLTLKVLKNTKGLPGRKYECDFDGERKIITERSKEKPFAE